MQSQEMQPEMTMLDAVLVRSAVGANPPALFYNWRSLWQTPPKEKAEVAERQINTLGKMREIGVLSDEATAVVGVNAMVETGAFPGIEKAAQEFPLLFNEDDTSGTESDDVTGDQPPPGEDAE